MRLNKDSAYIQGDTPILTNKGWKPISKIKRGSVIYDSRGHWTKVIHISQATQPFINYRMTFSDGNFIEGNSHLQFLTQTNQERQWHREKLYSYNEDIREAKLKELISSEPYYKFLNSNTYNKFLDLEINEYEKLYTIYQRSRYVDYDEISQYCPSIIPDPFTVRTIKIHPYVLGVWLVNGNRKQIFFKIRKKYILENFKKLNYELTRLHQYQLYRLKGVVWHFRKYKLFEQKHIPDSFKYNTLENRYHLLTGIRDGIGQKGGNTTKTTFVDPILYKDFCELLYTFNISVKKTSYTPPMINGIVFKKRLVATFQYPKLEELLNREKFQTRQNIKRWIKVTSCKKAKQTKMLFGIVVSSPEHSFLTGYSLIPTKDNYLKIDKRTISERK